MRQRKALGLEDLALSYQGGRGDFVHPTERKPSSMPKKREGVRNTEWGHGASGCWDTDTEPTTAQRRKSVEQGHGTGNGTEASRGPGNRHSSPGAHRVGPEVDRIGQGLLLVECLHFMQLLPELLGLTLFVGKAPDCRHG